jgi:hypothetical protein
VGLRLLVLGVVGIGVGRSTVSIAIVQGITPRPQMSTRGAWEERATEYPAIRFRLAKQYEQSCFSNEANCDNNLSVPTLFQDATLGFCRVFSSNKLFVLRTNVHIVPQDPCILRGAAQFACSSRGSCFLCHSRQWRHVGLGLKPYQISINYRPRFASHPTILDRPWSAVSQMSDLTTTINPNR